MVSVTAFQRPANDENIARVQGPVIDTQPVETRKESRPDRVLTRGAKSIFVVSRGGRSFAILRTRFIFISRRRAPPTGATLCDRTAAILAKLLACLHKRILLRKSNAVRVKQNSLLQFDNRRFSGCHPIWSSMFHNS